MSWAKDHEGMAWSRRVLGEPGPYIRVEAPQVLLATHKTVAAHHEALGLQSNDAYGLMWLKVPQNLLSRFAGVAGVRPVRPKRSRTTYAVVNGVPLVPWRYAKDRATEPERVRFGSSETRRALFGPGSVPDLQLELGMEGYGDAVVDELSADERERLAEMLADLKEIAINGQVAVLAYASSPDSLHRCHVGYADLAEDGYLRWLFREEVDLTENVGHSMRVVADREVAFDSGPVGDVAMRPRVKMRDTP